MMQAVGKFLISLSLITLIVSTGLSVVDAENKMKTETDQLFLQTIAFTVVGLGALKLSEDS